MFTAPRSVGIGLPGKTGIAFFIFLIAQVALSADQSLGSRHEPSGLNSTFRYSGVNFAEYIARTREMIASARLDLNDISRERIINGNAPFELRPPDTCPGGKTKPYLRGVLLVHGLTDSPYFMMSLGKFFQANCFRVMSILLPGHGTRPGDLLQVKWQEWEKAVAFGTNALAAEVDNIYLLGFSTGGTLAINQSLHDTRIMGLLLFSPAIKISSKAIMANWHEAIDWIAPKTKWIDILPDQDPYKYESFPANAADQIHLLSTQVRSELRKHKFMIPVFVAASAEDATVYTDATLEFFENAIHPLNTMILYTIKPGTENHGHSEKLTEVNSIFLDQRILGSAHTAIVLPPDDPHYGENGDYANCIHYFPDQMHKYERCKNDKYDYLGEVTENNLKKGILRRLMYNPNFQSLENSIKQFIDSLPSD